MNIIKAKLVSVESDLGHNDVPYTHLIIEAEAETQEGSYAKLNLEIEWNGFVSFLESKYKLWPPDAHSEATNPKRENYENDLIEWLNETLTWRSDEDEALIKKLTDKIARLERILAKDGQPVF